MSCCIPVLAHISCSSSLVASLTPHASPRVEDLLTCDPGANETLGLCCTGDSSAAASSGEGAGVRAPDLAPALTGPCGVLGSFGPPGIAAISTVLPSSSGYDCRHNLRRSAHTAQKCRDNRKCHIAAARHGHQGRHLQEDTAQWAFKLLLTNHAQRSHFAHHCKY